MKINTNRWNKIRYSFYQPFYDWIGNLFKSYRKLSISKLQLKPEDKVLILGAGTGLDLEFLLEQKHLFAIDITEAMISDLKRKAVKLGLKVEAQAMDGQKLKYPDETFDVVILHLIIAVIPDPYACINEVERVLKPSGRFTILDKFIEPGKKPGILRKFFGGFSDILFSAINRDIDEILGQTRLKKNADLKLKATYRIVVGEK